MLEEKKVMNKIILSESVSIDLISEGLRYHIENNVSLCDNVYRPFSVKWFALFREARKLWEMGFIDLSLEDEFLMTTDIGDFGIYEGEEVPLCAPMSIDQDILYDLYEAKHQGKEVELNKPKRNNDGDKAYVVYVKDGDRVKRVTYGDKNMKGNWNDPVARESFAARHQCEKKTDMTTPGYWACRAHKDFGKNVSGRYW